MIDDRLICWKRRRAVQSNPPPRIVQSNCKPSVLRLIHHDSRGLDRLYLTDVYLTWQRCPNAQLYLESLVGPSVVYTQRMTERCKSRLSFVSFLEVPSISPKGFDALTESIAHNQASIPWEPAGFQFRLNAPLFRWPFAGSKVKKPTRDSNQFKKLGEIRRTRRGP